MLTLLPLLAMVLAVAPPLAWLGWIYYLEHRADRVPILLYHWFHEPGRAVGASPELGVTPAEFRQQMQHLADGGFEILILDPSRHAEKRILILQ